MLLAGGLLGCNPIYAQPDDPSMLIENDVRVTTRAGFSISANVYRPNKDGRFPAGERVPVEIEILPSSTLFREGESLVVRVQGTELRGAGDITHLSSVNAGDHIVYVGGASDSQLMIPVVSD